MELRARRSLTLGALVAVAVAGWAPPLAAQAGSRPDERVLFLAPRPASEQDSTYVAQLAHEVRQRLGSRFRHRVYTITTEQVCDVLSQSGFRCGAILNPVDAERLARAFQADAYIDGDFWRDGAVPVVRYRMVDIGNSGLSGWQTARGVAGDAPRRFAEIVSDSLDNQIRAAEYARECLDRRDRGDFRQALDRARRAFELYPNHPAAANCAAVVLEAMQAPVDSQIVMYERAVRGDSVNQRALERLGRLYQAAGDSLKSLHAFRTLVEMNPDDRERWLGVVAGYITLRGYDEARELADEWLERHPGDLGFLQLKARACTEGERWRCALEALSAQYEIDSALAGDTIFYGRVIGAAQELGDRETVLRWANEAVRRAANPVPWMRVKATVFQDAGMTDSTIAMLDWLIARDSSEVATMLTLAKLLLDSIRIDTLTALDTVRLFKGERLLDASVARAPNDTAIRMNAAVSYYTVGQNLVQAQKPAGMAVRFLEKALRHDVLRRLQMNANFFLGWAILIQVYQLDPQVLETKSCDLVAQEAELIRRGKEAMTIGAPLSQQASRTFLQQYQQMEERIPQLRQAFCQ